MNLSYSNPLAKAKDQGFQIKRKRYKISFKSEINPLSLSILLHLI